MQLMPYCERGERTSLLNTPSKIWRGSVSKNVYDDLPAVTIALKLIATKPADIVLGLDGDPSQGEPPAKVRSDLNSQFAY